MNQVQLTQWINTEQPLPSPNPYNNHSLNNSFNNNPLNQRFNSQLNFQPQPTVVYQIPDSNNQQQVLMYNNNTQSRINKQQNLTTLPSQSYKCYLVWNILLFVGCGAFVVLVFGLDIMPVIIIQIIVIPLILYLCYSCTLSPLFNNMKTLDQFQNIYNHLRQKSGHIILTAQCFHKVGKYHRKVITHKAQQIIPVRICVDQSGEIDALKNKSPILRCQIQCCYYFGDVHSQNMFHNFWQTFTLANKQDKFQTYTHKLDLGIVGFQQEIGVSFQGSTQHYKYLNIIFVFLGLGYFYRNYLQSKITRLKVKNIKKISL